MTIISERLRKMQTVNGQSLHDLELEACEEIERLTHALKRIYLSAVTYFDADGEFAESIEEAVSTLAETGDVDAIAAQREWASISCRAQGEPHG